MNHSRTLFTYFSFSIIGAFFLFILVIRGLSHTSSLQFQEKLWIASLLLLCFLIGISFTIKPNWMRHFLYKKKNEKQLLQAPSNRHFQGHHPNCSTFQNHTIQWNGKILCAGCLGLFLGLCISIVVTIFYVMIDLYLTKMTALFLFFLGLLILPFVYIEILHRSTHATLHVFINALFPLSFFSITIAVGKITGDSLYGLISILLCALWLNTRIQLSKWHHQKLCTHCHESCKLFVPA